MNELKVDPENPSKEVVMAAARTILSGKIVAFPTDTVYGLGVNIYNELAMRRIYRAKGRLESKALIAFIADLDQLNELVSSVPVEAERLIKTFWPGALTLIMPASKRLPLAVTRNGTIGVRLPDNQLDRELVREVGSPLATTSANRSGLQSPTTADRVRTSLKGKIDLILDGGPIANGVESTIIDVTQNPPRILRQGAIAIGAIEKALKVG